MLDPDIEKLPTLGKYDFVYEDSNVYLESKYYPGGVELCYYRLATLEQMKPIMPDHVEKIIEQYKEKLPHISTFMIRQDLEELDICLNPIELLLKEMGFSNITLANKVKKKLPKFKLHQQRELKVCLETMNEAMKIRKLIKGE